MQIRKIDPANRSRGIAGHFDPFCLVVRSIDLAPDVQWIGFAGLAIQWKQSTVVGTIQEGKVMFPAGWSFEIVEYLQRHLDIALKEYEKEASRDGPFHPLKCLSSQFGVIFEYHIDGSPRWVIVSGHPRSQETADAMAQIATRTG